MNVKNIVILISLSCLIGIASAGQQTPDATGPSAIARSIGAIKAINGNSITLVPDSGAEIEVAVQPNARLLRIAPGEKDLKNAAPIQVQDLQVGDRIRVRGRASADAKSIAALEVIVIPHTDLDARHEQERQDWQKRGFGGLVKGVDPATGTVTISVSGLGGTKSVCVHTSKNTVIRRYSPDSVKFDDAKPSTLQDIQPGDQLRARGDKTPDGSELTAEEIVTGSFRNVAGTVNSVDASSGTINVQDLLSKKPVQVKVTAESQLHKLPEEMARRIAMRLKGSMPPGVPGAAGASTTPAAAPSGSNAQTIAPAAPVAGGAALWRNGYRREWWPARGWCTRFRADAESHAHNNPRRLAQRRRRPDCDDRG